LTDALANLECCEFVLADLDLPDGSGVELIRRIRESGGAAKVAVLSGVVDEEQLAAVDTQRPDAMFVKPILFSKLLAWMESQV